MAEFITVSQLTKTIGTRTLLDNVSVTLSTDQKIGIIGRNGAGKTTFFHIVLGTDEATSGTITQSAGLTIGYLRQHDDFSDSEATLAWMERTSGAPAWECAKAAHAFGITDAQLDQSPLALSGGYRMRVKLATITASEPNMLMLDEPTNYLDLSTLLLLERFINTFSGGVLLISHDREFLRRTCDHTLEVASGKLDLFPGTIDDYIAYKSERLAHAEAFNRNVEKKQEHLERFITRFRAKASKATQAQSKMKQLEKLQKVEIDAPLSTARIKFPLQERKKGTALDVMDLAIGYPNKHVAGPVNVSIERGQRIAVLGDNGQGKSTFLKTIAETLRPLNGRVKWGFGTQIGYFAQHVYEELNQPLTIVQYLEKEADPSVPRQQVLDTAGSLLFSGDDMHKSLSVLSGGERARVLLAKIILSNPTVMLLDEPTNHLDFETVELLGESLKDYAGTVLFISHDRTFISEVATGVIHVADGKIRNFPGPFDEFLSYLKNVVASQLISDSPKPTSKKQASAVLSGKAQRELTKKMQGIERKVEKLEAEKKQIHRLFALEPLGYSEEKTNRLEAIDAELASLESDWFTMNERLSMSKGSDNVTEA
ncbi:ABC transporter ATP-binding protein [bacterium]|nr:ABC transporter ATP-binding protein [bacterium]